MVYDPNRITFFAKTDARGQNVPFGIKAVDRTRHMYVIGKTGMGKSTLLENMAVQDMRNGEGLAFIDPHGATAETLLDYIPEERRDDVLYFAPFDMEYPVSFNVMEDVGADRRHLVVSGLMSVFEKIWVDAWSARMAYILQNTLMALLEYPDSTLLGVNRVLSDKNYRRKVVDNISDPSVKSFWVDEFAKYNERYMQEAGDAIKNKIGQFTSNPLIRNIIGQPKSSFDLRQIMDDQKIVIMNLSKGLVGESNANLLGSMLTTRIYLAAMSRADLTQEQMRSKSNFYFYVDEFQSFANATFADILSEARKYKLNLTIAHQYIEQMEEEVKNAVFGNVGTIAAFRVGPFDAEVLETIFAPQFQAIDVCNLGFAQIYLTLMIDGVGSQPFSAMTLPPLEKPSVSCSEMVIHASRQQYAKSRSEVEQAIIAWHEAGQESNRPNQDNTSQTGISREGGYNATGGGNGGQQRNINGYKGDRKVSGGNGNGGAPRDRGGQGGRGNGDRSEDRPKHRRESAKEKSLDELRSVLAGISSTTAEKDNKKVEKRESRPEPKHKPEVSGDRKSIERRENKEVTLQGEQQSRKEPVTNKEAGLRDALAEVVKAQSGAAPKSVPVPSAPVEQPTPVKINPEPANEAQTETPKVAPESPSIAPLPTQEQPTNLDPKALERMMRSKSDDKTPLK